MSRAALALMAGLLALALDRSSVPADSVEQPPLCFLLKPGHNVIDLRLPVLRRSNLQPGGGTFCRWSDIWMPLVL